MCLVEDKLYLPRELFYFKTPGDYKPPHQIEVELKETFKERLLGAKVS